MIEAAGPCRRHHGQHVKQLPEREADWIALEASLHDAWESSRVRRVWNKVGRRTRPHAQVGMIAKRCIYLIASPLTTEGIQCAVSGAIASSNSVSARCLASSTRYAGSGSPEARPHAAASTSQSVLGLNAKDRRTVIPNTGDPHPQNATATPSTAMSRPGTSLGLPGLKVDLPEQGGEGWRLRKPEMALINNIVGCLTKVGQKGHGHQIPRGIYITRSTGRLSICILLGIYSLPSPG